MLLVPFQHMLMQCWTSSTQISTKSTSWMNALLSAVNCLALKAFPLGFIFYFLESEKKPSSPQLDSHLFFPAPTGRLDWWMKVSRDNERKQLNVNLFWKVHKSHLLLGTCHKAMHFTLFFLQAEFARVKISHSLIFFFPLFSQRSKQFRANGRNVSYVVSVQKAARATGRVCSTAETYCTFQLPLDGKKKVYLSAVNAAGRSNPTEAQIHQPKGKPEHLNNPFILSK